MKNKNSYESSRNPESGGRSLGRQGESSRSDNASENKIQRTTVQNANAAGLGAMGRPDEKKGDLSRQGEMENEDIY